MKRMLYIAQQQMILQTAMNSYQKVLGCDESELGLYSGTSKQQDRRYVFATVQTMRQPEVLAQFKSDEFDYVLVITLEPKDISASSIISKMPTSCSA